MALCVFLMFSYLKFPLSNYRFESIDAIKFLTYEKKAFENFINNKYMLFTANEALFSYKYLEYIRYYLCIYVNNRFK